MVCVLIFISCDYDFREYSQKPVGGGGIDEKLGVPQKFKMLKGWWFFYYSKFQVRRWWNERVGGEGGGGVKLYIFQEGWGIWNVWMKQVGSSKFFDSGALRAREVRVWVEPHS